MIQSNAVPFVRVFTVIPLLVGLSVGLSLGLTGKLTSQQRAKARDDQAQFTGTATPAAQRMAGYEKHVELVAKSPWKKLPWQFLGPKNVSGRVTDVAVTTPRGKTYTIYAAGASGGLWKTDNEGTTWRPVFEHGASTSIGDVTLAPSDPDTVWIGTGEANVFRSSFAGCGVYKSTDAGETWQHMGLAGTHTIARIVIHPTNPLIVYVAASGHEWTHDDHRGLYKTVDGGKSWDKVLSIDEQTGIIDLVMHPSDPSILYASSWQRIRKRWNDPRNEDGYDGSSIYKSTNSGATWRQITKGLPEARWRGRIGIDLCQTQPETIYAFVDNYATDTEGPAAGKDSYGRTRKAGILGAEIYRSDNGGEVWRKVSQSNRYMRRLSSTYGWVFGQIRVDPSDPLTIYVMGISLNVSRDGGKTFARLRGMHGDHHALWIDPKNPKYLVNGNDGGANLSYDGGKTWKRFTAELPMAQFFNLGYDMDSPFRVYGSIQDHGSRRAQVDLRKGRGKIPAQDWENAPGGEGSSHAVDPTNPNTVYSAGFYGSITRTDLSTKKRTRLVPKAGKKEPALRGQWVAPFIVSPHNPRIIYHGMNRLYRSLDRGDGFVPISPDLTAVREDSLGDIQFHTLSTISESPLEFGVIYAGTDDGRVHVTLDSGDHWNDISGDLASDRWISRVEASHHQVGRVYLSQNGKRHDDFTPYLWKSEDHGATWKSIVQNIPIGPINVIREHPTDPLMLFVGTDLGVYVTRDGALTWEALPAELPTTFVSDLIVHPRDDICVISTHGRGMFALDIKVLARQRPTKGQK